MQIPVHKQVWIWGTALFAVLLMLWLLGNAIMPFLLGAAVAYLMDPVADRLERLGLSRTLSVIVISVVAAALFILVILFVLPIIFRQITQLIEAMPGMMQQVQGWLTAQFPELVPADGTLRSVISQFGSRLSELSANILSTVMGSVVSLVSLITLFVIVPVVAFYLLLDWDHMVARIDQLLPREHAPTLRRLFRDIDKALSGFVRGQGLVVLILGTFYSVSLGLIGLPFGVGIGAMAAMLGFIPYVGVLIGGATAIGVALFSFWGDWLWIGAVIAVFAFGQMVEGNYLQPKIVGGQVGLHPVWLMLALTVFGTMFGFVGLLAAVPIAASLGVLVRFAAERYRESALYTGKEVPPPPPQPVPIELVPRGTIAREREAAEMAAESKLVELRLENAVEEAKMKPKDAKGKPKGAHQS
ncbi:AI-2E family transporter [Paracoccus pacificus]|uniref:AI-2E family transporter n=1 Tax=Paracoccus pacificus TaxID=1463598 RepID=A0ABW4R9N2_9RHOB